MHDFDQALLTAQRAIDFDGKSESLHRFNIVATSNKAHALMFLGRLDEATRAYASGRGHFQKDNQGDNQKSWEKIIEADFAALRRAGLSHPFMKKITALFNRKKQ